MHTNIVSSHMLSLSLKASMQIYKVLIFGESEALQLEASEQRVPETAECRKTLYDSNYQLFQPHIDMHTTLNYFGFVQMLKSHPYAAMQSSTIETEPELRGKDVKAATPASTTCNGHSVSAPLLGCQMLRSLYSQIKATVDVVNSLKGKFTWQRTAVRACLGAATPAIWTMSYRRCRKRQLSKTLARAFPKLNVLARA